MHEAKTHLSRLVARVAAGEEIVITRHGAPAARLVPVERPNRLAEVRGAWRGRVRLADDFDDVPPEIAEAFGLR
jgi:prevent-host-death family protein